TVLVALGLTLVAGLAPVGVAAQAATEIPVFHNQLEESTAAGKLTITDEPLASLLAPHARTATVIQPVAAPKATTTAAKTTSTSTEPATAEAPRDETSDAQSILAGYISKYPILAGTTVTFGDAQGYQAIAYYKSGRIVISADHTASLSRIIGHEIWHIIDYRDNGVIDWGENIPPN
ncbi:MAG: hypothetical protein JXA36_06320, partial [Coriobacteriia bacterium]|nr:hypothetical protein [Coriobacteriia bacterium]